MFNQLILAVLLNARLITLIMDGKLDRSIMKIKHKIEMKEIHRLG